MKAKIILALILTLSFRLIASDIIPGKPQNKPVALVGGTIHTITKGTIENGIVLFDKGKIGQKLLKILITGLLSQL